MTRLEDTYEFQKLLRLFQEMPPNRKRALLDHLEHEDTTGVMHESDEGLTLAPELVAMIYRFQGLPTDKQRAILESFANKSNTEVAQILSEVFGHDQ